jgi:hypothetical protein
MAKTPRIFLNAASKTTDYTLTFSDDTISFDATAATRTATFPDAIVMPGKTMTVRKTDTSTNLVNILFTNSQTADARASIVLRAFGDYVTLQSNGASWTIVSKKETENYSNIMQLKQPAPGAPYSAMVNNSTTLTPGVWEVEFGFHLYGGNLGGYIRTDGTLFLANGNDTTTVPTTIPTSMIISGNNSFYGNTVSAGIVPNGTDYGIATAKLRLTLNITTTTTVYAVPRVTVQTSGPYVSGIIEAKRIW